MILASFLLKLKQKRENLPKVYLEIGLKMSKTNETENIEKERDNDL